LTLRSFDFSVEEVSGALKIERERRKKDMEGAFY